ncbi:DUF2933 domain-containing protein [Labrenzia sp. R4_2]|uniref:DUF2933 domain-containing protein n=1 Tax=Labrenzia sp. R4_2 TaxID=2821107 RepID=UPI001ADAEB25|nr:DUF2933 domain-containing protein [Labrenzia sp. R4_2]MBO9423029.1 DUF2933 domain-containing protein [Labrenzia sp. R4_2]
MTIHETNSETSTSVPQVRAKTMDSSSPKSLVTGHNLFMLACCLAMVVGTGFLIASAPAGQTIGQTLLLAAPMLGCVGMHLIMHRFMGKSCHGDSPKNKDND